GIRDFHVTGVQTCALPISGLVDEPADLVRPFYTRRPEGMGMGLYYANMVMELNDGALLFPELSETEVPERYDGAIVALRFKKLRSEKRRVGTSRSSGWAAW